MLAEQTVAQVKEYPDIVGIISEYVSLKKRGRNYVGLCPFHSEKTPSFTVSPEKKMYHCFGCHESGDHIGFLMKIDNLNFAEAVRHIAQKAGIEIIEDAHKKWSKEDQDLELLRDALYWSREYFEGQLQDHAQAKQYFIDRGLTDAIIKSFHLGWASPDADISAFYVSKGLSPDVFCKAGVVIKRTDGRWINRFANRVIFPILDGRGRTVGFAGRVISDDKKAPKYINSEDTKLFNKRKLLYGLSQARSEIQKNGYVLLMEGYMDVLMAHQHGFENAVATMGTAITSDHARQLKRFASKVYLAMDADDAGQKSIERSLSVLDQFELKPFILSMPHKDPCDVLVSNGPALFSDLVKTAKPVIEFVFERALKRHDISHIDGINAVLNEVIDYLRKEKELVIQRHYVKLIAQKLNIQEELILAQLKPQPAGRRRKVVVSPNKIVKDKYEKAQEALVYLASMTVGFRTELAAKITPEQFISPELGALYGYVIASDLEKSDLIESCSDLKMKSLLGRILVGDELSDISIDQWPQYVRTIRGFQTEKRIGELKELIKESEKLGQDERTDQLLTELQQLIANS